MSPWCDICGHACRVWFSQCCMLSRNVSYKRYFDKLPNKVSPQVNEALTPRACQALLAYTFTLGEPVRCIPSFLQCLRNWSVTVIEHSTLDLALGTSQEFSSDRVSAEILLHSTPPMHSLAFRILDQSQCTQTFQA